ncbi:hypothetical protein HK100_004842 [Physocladia obscura]|uniref:Uncharacterized protein n=1 Tax=Physocladia obscura TaxID=109957 RepID=A0AAD5T6V2_9FUNG|nr:hypothetical protein HK100_004842 [Physocladia obscura]
MRTKLAGLSLDFRFARMNLLQHIVLVSASIHDYLFMIKAKRTINFHTLSTAFHAAFLSIYGFTIKTLDHFEISLDTSTFDPAFVRRGRRVLPAVKLAQHYQYLKISSVNASLMAIFATIYADFDLLGDTLIHSSVAKDPLYGWAAAANQVPSISYLLSHARKGLLSAPPASALIVASTHGHVEILRLLLPADPATPSPYFFPSTISCALISACENGRDSCAEILLACTGVDPAHNKNAAIVAAVCNGHTALVARLLSSVPHAIDPAAYENKCILVACERGYIDIARMLLSDLRVDPSANDNAPLMDAVHAGNFTLVDALMKTGRVNVAAQENRAIRIACLVGSKEIATALLKNPAVDPTARDNEAFVNAAKNGFAEIVDMLLDWRSLADVTEVDPSAQNNMAIILAARNGHDQVIGLLLQRPVVNPAVNNNLPLFEACANGHLKIVQLLSSRNLKLEQSVLIRCTEAACKNNHPQILEFLSKNYSTFIASISPACLMKPAQQGHYAVIEFLLDNYETQFHPLTLTRALTDAAAGNHVAVVQKMVNSNVQYSVSQALVKAASAGYRGVVLAIIKSSARRRVVVPHEAVQVSKYKEIKEILQRNMVCEHCQSAALIESLVDEINELRSVLLLPFVTVEDRLKKTPPLVSDFLICPNSIRPIRAMLQSMPPEILNNIAEYIPLEDIIVLSHSMLYYKKSLGDIFAAIFEYSKVSEKTYKEIWPEFTITKGKDIYLEMKRTAAEDDDIEREDSVDMRNILNQAAVPVNQMFQTWKLSKCLTKYGGSTRVPFISNIRAFLNIQHLLPRHIDTPLLAHHGNFGMEHKLQILEVLGKSKFSLQYLFFPGENPDVKNFSVRLASAMENISIKHLVLKRVESLWIFQTLPFIRGLIELTVENLNETGIVEISILVGDCKRLQQLNVFSLGEKGDVLALALLKQLQLGKMPKLKRVVFGPKEQQLLVRLRAVSESLDALGWRHFSESDRYLYWVSNTAENLMKLSALVAVIGFAAIVSGAKCTPKRLTYYLVWKCRRFERHCDAWPIGIPAFYCGQILAIDCGSGTVNAIVANTCNIGANNCGVDMIAPTWDAATDNASPGLTTCQVSLTSENPLASSADPICFYGPESEFGNQYYKLLRVLNASGRLVVSASLAGVPGSLSSGNWYQFQSAGSPFSDFNTVVFSYLDGSQSSFTLDQLFKKGWKQPLVFSELYQIPKRLHTQTLADTFFVEWDKQLKAYIENHPEGKRPNPEGKLLRAVIIKLVGAQVLSLGVLLLLSNICNLFAPYFVQWILDFATKKYSANNGFTDVVADPIGKGLGLVFGLLLTQILGSFFSNHFIQESAVSAISLRTMMTSVIYRKSLKLASSARQEFSAGNVVNLISTDTNRVEVFVTDVNYIWTIPVVALGWPAVCGIAVLIFSIPLQKHLFSLMMKIRSSTAPISGKRVNLTTEILSGVRVIKFFAWENAFVQKVAAIRNSEIALVLKRSQILAFIMTQAQALPVLCSCITFMIYGSIHTLEPSAIFSSLSWFNQLRLPLIVFPIVLNASAEFTVALGRIEALLLAAEVENLNVIDSSSEYAVSIENGEFEWSGEVYGHGFDKPKTEVSKRRGPSVSSGNDTPRSKSSEEVIIEKIAPQVSSLKNINLHIKKGELVAIVGAVGSGKSSLLNAFIGEMRKVSGNMKFSGSLSYAAQTAWIQNATVKENIVFGKPFDKQKYLHALVDSALLPDMKVLQDADNTSIGERGINLSGGQKQRVNMARLLYCDSDIVLIDDPLSAVDAHVGAHLFTRCIKNALAARTRILVTHQLHFLPQCDKVVVMKDGYISEQGTYQELISNNEDFARMIASHGAHSNDDSEDDELEGKEQLIAKREKEVVELEGILETKQTGKDIMTVEDQETGNVSASVWINYVKASGGLFGFVIPLIFILIVYQLSYVGNNLWLTWWTDNQFNMSTKQYLIGYIILAIIMAAGTYAYAIFLAYSGTRASKSLHTKALERILRAPVYFFDTTPLGRIINRFSRDIDAIDNNLSFSFRQLISQVGISVSTFIVMCTAIPWFTVPCIPAIAIYYWIATVYRKTARELKRLDSTSKSPLYANFGETLAGISTIRAYKDQVRFTLRNDNITDKNNSPYFLLQTAANWLSIRLQLIGSLLVLCAALIGVVSTSLSPSLFGLCLSYALSVTQVLSFMIQNFTQCEIAMNSVERIERYAYDLEVEADAIIEGHRPAETWPHEGTIFFENVVMRYAPNLPIVLNKVSFSVKNREKIGIVGRTGSGKSSMLQALFRMVEPASGKIVVDGVDISTIGLSDLRSNIAIIPQDPVVFSGTFRSNMDPFSEYNDNELWDALARAGLKAKVSKSDNQLDGQVDSGGENLSVGERQLLCLARAMLKTPKILIMDEATANHFKLTDAMIQKALREDFKNATVLTIAHRLNTVIDYDRVMVLDKGMIAEFDSPKNLLADKNSMFSQLVAQTGESNAKMLKEMAV